MDLFQDIVYYVVARTPVYLELVNAGLSASECMLGCEFA